MFLSGANRWSGLFVTVLVAATVLLPADLAVADAGDVGEVANFALEPGDSRVYGTAEIEGLRQSDVAERQLSASQIEDARSDLVEESLNDGVYVEPQSVDVIPLLGGDASIALDEDQVVESATIRMSDQGVLSVSAKTTERDPETATLAGPGMAATWDANGNGSYKIKIYVDFSLDGRGSLLYASGFFSWKRYKLLNDGDASKVFYRYERYGDFQPESISFVEDAKVRRLRIQSFPYDSVEPYLKDWERFSPGSDRPDDCSSYNASVSFKAISVSVPFNERCGAYNMWRNVDKASSYWIQYENGNGGSGNREVAYVLVWSQEPGSAGSMHDLQLIETLIGGCQQTDASRTCSW